MHQYCTYPSGGTDPAVGRSHTACVIVNYMKRLRPIERLMHATINAFQMMLMMYSCIASKKALESLPIFLLSIHSFWPASFLESTTCVVLADWLARDRFNCVRSHRSSFRMAYYCLRVSIADPISWTTIVLHKISNSSLFLSHFKPRPASLRYSFLPIVWSIPLWPVWPV